MAKPQTLVSRIYISLNGTQVERRIMQDMVEVVIEQHAHLPGYFTLRFHDPDLKLLDQGPFDLAKEVEIKAATENDQKVSIFKGEITSLEPSFGDGMVAELVVRGYDKSHRLYRESKSRAFLNKKDSDLASELANESGLQVQVEQTSTVYEHIFQPNQSNLAFLMQRAWRIGFECFVQDGKLFFRKPPSGSASLTLKWGEELLSFHPRMTLAEQVDEVIVRGWDPEKKEPIVGKATRGQLYPKVGESKNGAEWAKDFGAGKYVIVDQPVVSQAEANTLAAARLNELSGAFIQAEGETFRRPEIRAGQLIKIENVGKRFSGTYLVTRVRHELTAQGLLTSFSVQGTRSGLLSEEIRDQEPLDRWPGVVVGIVTNTNDPKKWGRVKVKFPWMTDDAESNWARVMGIGAGPEAGLFVLPEVNDEVLVIFAHGDFNQPYVLGGLWNGQTKLPPEGAGAAEGEMPKVRLWRSLTGHKIAIYDNADNKIEIVTKAGHQISLDDANKKIVITSKGGQTVTLDDNSRKVILDSKGDVELKSGGNLKISATGNMDISANGNMTIKGATINLN